jgi:hypothetical protein
VQDSSCRTLSRRLFAGLCGQQSLVADLFCLDPWQNFRLFRRTELRNVETMRTVFPPNTSHGFIKYSGSHSECFAVLTPSMGRSGSQSNCRRRWSDRFVRYLVIQSQDEAASSRFRSCLSATTGSRCGPTALLRGSSARIHLDVGNQSQIAVQLVPSKLTSRPSR